MRRVALLDRVELQGRAAESEYLLPPMRGGAGRPQRTRGLRGFPAVLPHRRGRARLRRPESPQWQRRGQYKKELMRESGLPRWKGRSRRNRRWWWRPTRW